MSAAGVQAVADRESRSFLWWDAAAVFVIGELVLIGLTFVFGFIPEWWLHGERHTGVVIAAEENGDEYLEVTIRDPDTELDQVVTPDFWSPKVGDTGTAVVSRSDPSKVGTTGQVAAYFACGPSCRWRRWDGRSAVVVGSSSSLWRSTKGGGDVYCRRSSEQPVGDRRLVREHSLARRQGRSVRDQARPRSRLAPPRDSSLSLTSASTTMSVRPAFTTCASARTLSPFAAPR